MSAPLRPTHLLILDHPLGGQGIDRRFRQAGCDPSARPVPGAIVDNGVPGGADICEKLLSKAVEPGGRKIAVLAQVIHIRDLDARNPSAFPDNERERVLHPKSVIPAARYPAR
jgi:hypothetical protein